MKNKRGELTSKQLITIIILIVSFAVILIFFINLNLRSNIDSESCRNSVVLRGVFNVIPKAGGLISLKCKSQDVCLSMGGDCSVVREDMEKIQVNSENELFKEMAELIVDCWWMMGEGKVEYADEGDCAICHNIYFDEEIKEKYPDNIEVLKLYQYMAENDIPNSEISYLYYLYEMSAITSVRNKIIGDSTGNYYDINDKSKAKIWVNEDFTVVTSLGRPPMYVQFKSSDLKAQSGCSGYVTES